MWFVVVFCPTKIWGNDGELHGYTEPFRTIAVSTDETGTIDEVLVREGERVQAGQPLVRLNNEVYQALLAIADQNRKSQGRLDATRAELNLRKQRLEKLVKLREDGHAQQAEVDQAVAEVAIAEANVLSAREELRTRQLEYERIVTQIARRTVRAPIAGVVTKLDKEVGEFVAPNDPNVLILVQVTKLLANFTLNDAQAAQLRAGQTISVRFLESGLVTEGTVELVSPTNDAESGTVLAKIRIDNQEGRYRSGQRCAIRLETANNHVPRPPPGVE